VDSCGNLYLADKDNIRIRKVAFNPTCIAAKVNNNVVLAGKLTVFPNPATTSLTVLSTNQPITTITITNLFGQTIYASNYNTQTATIDVSNLPFGMYLIKINGSEVRKFVKE